MPRRSAVSSFTPASVTNEPDTKNTRNIIIKGKAPVDSECEPKINSAHVFYEDDIIYDVLLNQLIEDDAVMNYSVWYRWGRVGRVGQSKLESYGSDLEGAKEAFIGKFYAKTFNHWSDRTNFVKVDGKYDIVHLDYAIQSDDVPAKKKKRKTDSKLSEPTFLLMSLICDLRNMEETIAELKYDAKRSPLGKLTNSQIKAGYDALKRVSDAIDKILHIQKSDSIGPNVDHPLNPDDIDMTARVRRPKRASSNAGELRKARDDLLVACNQFYTRIPHDFGMRIPPLISTPKDLKEKLELLEALEKVDFAVKIINTEPSSNLHPLDTIYHRLNCDMERISESDETTKMILDYIHLTHAPTHSHYKLNVLDVFKCHRASESENFHDVGSRMLLWHGSRLVNWMGILSHGLQVAPPEAPVTGYMFGKGIYFADCASKSANYAYPTRTRNIGLIILCEVSLGSSKEYIQACYSADKNLGSFNSVKGLGKLVPDSRTWRTIENGLIVPIGKLLPSSDIRTKTSALQYNEYIVYDTTQIRLRYLIKVKFDFV